MKIFFRSRSSFFLLSTPVLSGMELVFGVPRLFCATADTMSSPFLCRSPAIRYEGGCHHPFGQQQPPASVRRSSNPYTYKIFQRRFCLHLREKIFPLLLHFCACPSQISIHSMTIQAEELSYLALIVSFFIVEHVDLT